MEQKRLVLYFLTVLYLFCFLSIGSLGIRNLVALSIDEENQVTKVEISAEEEFIEGRMDFESLDYPGSGANSRHEPRVPGRP